MVKMAKMEKGLGYDVLISESEMRKMQDTTNQDTNSAQGKESLLVTVNIDKQGRIVIPKVIRDRHKGSLEGGQQLYLIDRGEKIEIYLDFRKLPLSEF